MEARDARLKMGLLELGHRRVAGVQRVLEAPWRLGDDIKPCIRSCVLPCGPHMASNFAPSAEAPRTQAAEGDAVIPRASEDDLLPKLLQTVRLGAGQASESRGAPLADSPQPPRLPVPLLGHGAATAPSPLNASIWGEADHDSATSPWRPHFETRDSAVHVDRQYCDVIAGLSSAGEAACDAEAMTALVDELVDMLAPRDQRVRRATAARAFSAWCAGRCIGTRVHTVGLSAAIGLVVDGVVDVMMFTVGGKRGRQCIDQISAALSSQLTAECTPSTCRDESALLPGGMEVLSMSVRRGTNAGFCLGCEVAVGGEGEREGAGTVALRLRTDCLEDLVLAAFVEEVDQLVGRNHLFKKTLWLFRTWWRYGCGPPLERRLAEAIGDAALTTMVLYVFNHQWWEMRGPVDALCRVIKCFCSFDWSAQVVTLEGIVAVEDPRFQQLCSAWSEALRGGVVPGYALGRGNEGCSLHETGGVRTGRGKGDAAMGRGEAKALLIPPALLVKYRSLLVHDCRLRQGSRGRGFERRLVNICHPLVLDWNTVVATGQERPIAAHIYNRMRSGAGIMRELCDAHETGAGPAVIFPILKRLVGLPAREEGTRATGSTPCAGAPAYEAAAAVGGAALGGAALGISAGDNPWASNLTDLKGRIDASMALLDTNVSADVLRSLAVECLRDAGGLAVGELGKLLLQVTGISSLMLTLRNRYGGLKRFLEEHPDDFVLDSDHPYNPTVYARHHMGHGGFATFGANDMKTPRRRGKKKRASGRARPASAPIPARPSVGYSPPPVLLPAPLRVHPQAAAAQHPPGGTLPYAAPPSAPAYVTGADTAYVRGGTGPTHGLPRYGLPPF